MKNLKAIQLRGSSCDSVTDALLNHINNCLGIEQQNSTTTHETSSANDRI